MGSFGEAVDSLLSTYTKCLSLLKGLRQEGKPNDSQSRLGSSIRSDRSKVRRVYSSRLSVKGTSFEKGDAPARSSLRRVIKKLTRTLERLMRTVTRSQRDPVDYASLMSLSNVSRQDAIRTMSDLSRRVGSTSSSRSTKSHGKSGNARKRKSSALPGKKREQGHGRDAATGGDKHNMDLHSKSHSNLRENRLSVLTVSSGSTKLGEVRRERSREQRDDAYNSSRVMYPLHPHSSQKPQKPKKWWGLFSR